jgi:type II secretory pathway pseudopilin PulG
MQGGKNRQPLGYTIVEVLIVLAVSAMMFVVAANFINGKQERTAFNQGSNELVSQLQSILDDVKDGHYSDVPINCSTASGPVTFPVVASPGQGSNQDCVFMGKLVHFYESGTPLPERYEVISLAAKRADTGSVLSDVAPIMDLTTQVTVPQSLDITDIQVTDSSGLHLSSSIGFAQSLIVGGSTQPMSIVYNNPSLSNSGPITVSTSIDGSNTMVAQSAIFCVTDGTRQAKIIIGGNGNQLNIDIEQQGLGDGSVCT